MRILHVTPYAGDAWAYGGIPRIVDTLARGLARRGHYVTVCTTDACDASSRLAAAPEASTPDGVTVRVFPNVSNALAYRLQLFAPRGLGAYLRRAAPSFDVAHLHAFRNAPGVIAAYHLSRGRIPYLVAPNGTAAVVGRRQLAKRAFDLVAGRRILAGAGCVLAVSDAERRQVREMGSEEALIRMIPNPVELDEFREPRASGAFRASLGLAPSQPLVMYLGTLMPRKRLDVVVDAFSRLTTDARLVIAGNDMGAEPATRTHVRALGLDARVVFTGLLRGSDRLDALADADVVVYPSEHEVFGLVPLEALLAGTPVIVADDSGCGEVVGATGGGQIVPVGDGEALARAIHVVLNAPDAWHEKVARAQARIRATYAADVVCEQLEGAYADMVSEA